MSSCWHYEIRKWLGGVGCVFFHFTIEGERSGVASWSVSGSERCLGRKLLTSGEESTSCNLVCLLRVADLLSLTSCVRTYEWLLIYH